jgi:hypothetical protein
VCRIAYGNNDIEVEATDEKEARRKAVELAPNLDFSTHDVEYKPQTEASLKIESMLKPLTRWKAQRTQREEL